MDLVILSGSVGKGAAWTRGCIKSLLPLPVAGSTLIEALVRGLDFKTSGKCIICSDGHKDQFVCRLGLVKPANLKIDFFEDSVPLGTAGCLKACEKLTDSDTILLVGGSVWLDDDPQWMLEQHRKTGNALTVFCTRDPGWAGLGSQRHLRPAGVFCCDRSVFQHIRPTGFQDLKEQLVPALKRAGLRVGTVGLPNETCEVSDPATYLEIIARILATGRFLNDRFVRIAPDIWCGRDVHIAAHARIAGPALLGHGCRIEDGAVIVGPTMLGDDSHIGPNARLFRVVAATRLRVRPGVCLTDRVITAPSLPSSSPSQPKTQPLTCEPQPASHCQRATPWPGKLATPLTAVGTVLFAAFIWAFWSSISNLWTYLGSNVDPSAGSLVPVAGICIAAARARRRGSNCQSSGRPRAVFDKPDGCIGRDPGVIY